MRCPPHCEPSPRARALAAGITLVGVVASPSPYALVVLLVACVAILTTQGKINSFVRFIFRVWVPLSLGLFIVWGLIVRGSPGTGNGSGIADGAQFAALVSLRVAALAAVFQAAVLSLGGLRLVVFLRKLGLSPTATATVASVINLWPDFARRSEQVVAARCARGLMSDRHLWTRIRQVPWIVRTLFVGSLGHSLDRATRWQAECLPSRLADVAVRCETRQGSPLVNVAWCVASVTWTVCALWRP
jgi:energy-coupling factor transporter transmembrane protein EcfT